MGVLLLMTLPAFGHLPSEAGRKRCPALRPDRLGLRKGKIARFDYRLGA
jgi:hypothetical protein